MDLDQVSRLARLTISDKDKEGLQLEKIIVHFEKLKKIETKNIEPLITPVEIEQNLREDLVTETLTSEEALLNASEQVNGGFKVPPVV